MTFLQHTVVLFSHVDETFFTFKTRNALYKIEQLRTMRIMVRFPIREFVVN